MVPGYKIKSKLNVCTIQKGAFGSFCQNQSTKSTNVLGINVCLRFLCYKSVSDHIHVYSSCLDIVNVSKTK